MRILIYIFVLLSALSVHHFLAFWLQLYIIIYLVAAQAPPSAHPLITRTAPRHKARVPHRVEYRLAHRPRGMPGYAHQAGDAEPASRGPWPPQGAGRNPGGREIGS